MDPGLGNMAVKPVFYEQSPYELVVENRGESEIKFRHVNSRIQKCITPVGSSGRLLSGVVNFGNDIGYSDFVVCVDGKSIYGLQWRCSLRKSVIGKITGLL